MINISLHTLDLLRFAGLFEIFFSIGFVLASVNKVADTYKFPVYIWGMTFSYVLFALGGASEILVGLGHSFDMITIFAIVGATISMATQLYTLFLLESEPRRITSLTSFRKYRPERVRIR